MEYLTGLEKDIEKFKTDLYRLAWYMRGGVTINDLLHIYSFDDRQMMSKVIDENIDNSVKSGMPLI